MLPARRSLELGMSKPMANETPPWHPIEYVTITAGVLPQQPGQALTTGMHLFERATWIYTPLKNGGFSLKFSWYAWFLRKLHGPNAEKNFWFIRRKVNVGPA